jgi:hypothetical protein
MRAIIGGIILAAGLATAAAVVLDTGVQRSTTERFQKDGVRL